MGVMIEGVYHAQDPCPDTTLGGTFERAKSTIRYQITPDGPFTPTPGRYHLYAAWNCPWAHRVLLTRAILGLQDAVAVSYARPRRTDDGWVFDDAGEYSDPELGVSALHQVYARQAPPYTGRITVPILWDRQTEQIVTNESADLVRMLAAFGGPDLSPAAHLAEIDHWNDLIYRTLNNGVYRAGFARTQAAYDTAVAEVFDTLGTLENHLTGRAWLVGDTLTEADIRLFPTLARFDVAYHYAFKCNLKRLVDYPNLWAYARRIYHLPGVTDTVRFEIYKAGYFSPSELRNPLGIPPAR
ncbi:MAG: glutathione S-transferase C-terminal domain-containing protein [Pseudomonadota bacterium]